MLKNSIAFIFDMDGTIVDNMQFHTQAWLRFLAEMNLSISEDELQRQNHGTIEEVIRRLCGSHLSKAEVVALGNRKESLYRELYRPHLQLIAGFRDFVREAQALRIPMAIGTSAGQANLDLVMQGLNIGSYFDVFITGEQVKYGKPHPETFQRAAQQLGVQPGQCIVFEDLPAGIEAAQHAGMRSIALTTTFPAHTFKHLNGVQRIISDYTSLYPAFLINLRYELSAYGVYDSLV